MGRRTRPHLTPGLPLRATGEAYKGANVLLLWTAQIARGLDTLKGYFTDPALRAREELRAELGAAIIAAMTGLAPHHLEDRAAYVADWLTLLKSDPRAFLSAGARAQAAVDWLIARAGHPADMVNTQAA